VVNYGTGKSARAKVQAAGKTGTTSQSRDLWFVGYTPELSTAVWLGNSNNDAIKGAATYGGTCCGPIWRDYMNALVDAGLLAHRSAEWVEPEASPVEQAPETTPNNGGNPEPQATPNDTSQETNPQEQPVPVEPAPEQLAPPPGENGLTPPAAGQGTGSAQVPSAGSTSSEPSATGTGDTGSGR